MPIRRQADLLPGDMAIAPHMKASTAAHQHRTLTLHVPLPRIATCQRCAVIVLNGPRTLSRCACHASLAQAGADLNATDLDGCHALHLCATAGDIDTAELLVELGADRAAPDANGKLPHAYAQSRGFQALANILAT